MLRRLYHDQPEHFAFTPANREWAEAQMTKFPEGRQASAVIPLLWRAQEQEGWLSRPAIEEVARMLDMAYIRALEVATFYFMFQLQPVGSVAHVQVCGTTSCMICGAEDLIAVCRKEIAARPHELSADGKFSWEEVECLGACANAPMAQIGKDYYEDLTADSLRDILRALADGKVPKPGSQIGRFSAEPKSGLTSLESTKGGEAHNGSVALALALGDTVKRIDGTELPLTTPWLANRQDVPDAGTAEEIAESARDASGPTEGHPEAENAATGVASSAGRPKGETGQTAGGPKAAAKGAEDAGAQAAAAPGDDEGVRPEALDAPRGGKADDLKLIKGVGPKLEALLNRLGFYHFDQVAKWTPAEIAWVDRNLEGFKGRVTRDQWVAQARTLADGGETEFSRRSKS